MHIQSISITVLAVLCIDGFHLSAFASSRYSASRYKRLQFTPATIQDVPIRFDGAPIRPAVPVGATPYKVDLDIFFLPDEMEAPAFAGVRFNVQKQDQKWVQVELEYELAQIATAYSHNVLEASVSALREALVPFDDDHVVFRFASQRPRYRARRSGYVHPHFAMVAGLPHEMFRRPSGAFPISLDMTFAVFNFSEIMQTVRHRKSIRGSGFVTVLTAEEEAEVANLLRLVPDCNSALRGPQRVN